jgi:molecular chaperone HtpG
MLLPDYLRFAKGVVDSSDLPLNVSREMLQDDGVIRKIKSAVTSKILSTLEDLKKKAALAKDGETPAWRTFWDSFGAVLKEGVHTDRDNAERIKKLLMYPSAKSTDGKLITLEEYVKDMAPGQDAIYFLCAPKVEAARVSPQIEQALKHKCDVLFFCDPVDEWLIDSLGEFDGKKFVDVARGDVQFGTETEREAEKNANEKSATELKPLMDEIKKRLESDVSEVRLSTRLADSPCCLVASEHALSPAMERMMRAMNKEAPKEKRILELNGSHPLIAKIKTLEGDALDDAAHLLYAGALVAEGSTVPDPVRFNKLLANLMMK